jgi:hypothetical protein
MFWTWKGRCGQPGRPSVSQETRDLICQMSRDNPLMGRAAHPRRIAPAASTSASSTATTVRIADCKPQVLESPLADAKEQLGGCYIIDVGDLDAALSWAARCPAAGHGLLTFDPCGRIARYERSGLWLRAGEAVMPAEEPSEPQVRTLLTGLLAVVTNFSRILRPAAPSRSGGRPRRHQLTVFKRNQLGLDYDTWTGCSGLRLAVFGPTGRMPCSSSRRTPWCPGIALASSCFGDCVPAPDRSD